MATRSPSKRKEAKERSKLFKGKEAPASQHVLSTWGRLHGPHPLLWGSMAFVAFLERMWKPSVLTHPSTGPTKAKPNPTFTLPHLPLPTAVHTAKVLKFL